MQQDYAESFLRSGIIEAKAGQKSTARRYLERALYASNNNKHETMAEAWFWMAEVTDDPVEKRKALENALAHDLGHVRARRALAILDGKIDPAEIVNPDALPPAPSGLRKVKADRFMCPKCGGRMSFAPDGQSLVCEYCTRNESLQALPAETREEDFLAAMATMKGHRLPLSQQGFHCSGCSAEFFLPPTLISASCMYCGSPYVVQVNSKDGFIAPEAVLPHCFDRKQAGLIFERWIKGHKSAARVNWAPPRGLYLPIWTFDLTGEIGYRGEIVVSESHYDERVPKVIQVNDSYPVFLDDLPIPATRKLARPLAALLPGFDLKGLKAYDPRYLVDWPAEVFDVPVSNASLDARSKAYQRVKEELASARPDVRLLSTSSAGLRVESFKLVLVPVWLARVRNSEKLLLISGQNGAAAASGFNEKQGLLDWLADAWES